MGLFDFLKINGTGDIKATGNGTDIAEWLYDNPHDFLDPQDINQTISNYSRGIETLGFTADDFHDIGLPAFELQSQYAPEIHNQTIDNIVQLFSMDTPQNYLGEFLFDRYSQAAYNKYDNDPTDSVVGGSFPGQGVAFYPTAYGFGHENVPIGAFTGTGNLMMPNQTISGYSNELLAMLLMQQAAQPQQAAYQPSAYLALGQPNPYGLGQAATRYIPNSFAPGGLQQPYLPQQGIFYPQQVPSVAASPQLLLAQPGIGPLAGSSSYGPLGVPGLMTF